jgi:uroporphyrinogen decarboxylase
MYDGVMDDIRVCARLGVPARVPVFALSEEFDVKWHGRYAYEDVCRDGDKMAEVWIAAAEAFDYDWVWLQVDDCFEIEPLGVGCYGEGNILRATKDYLPPSRETLRGLRVPDPLRAGRMPEKLKALRLIRKHVGERACVAGGLAAPFSAAGLLYGLTDALLMIHEDPELLRETIDFLVESQTSWGLAQLDAGAHALWLGDCNAMSNLISAEHYKRFALEPCARVVEACRKAGGLVFLHNSEERAAHIELSVATGADIINVGPGIEIGAAKEILRGKACLGGNLEPISLLMNGAPEAVAAEAERIMDAAAPGGGFIFNTGEMNPRDVPEVNMRAMMRAAKAQTDQTGRSGRGRKEP